MIERVALTGIGPVTPVGIGRGSFDASLQQGACGIDEVTAFEVPEGGPTLAAEVVDLDVEEYLRSTKNYLDRNSELAFAACELAIRDSGLILDEADLDRLGICTGTEWGNVQTLATFAAVLAEKGPRLAPPFLFPHLYPSTTNSLLSIEYGVRGANRNLAGFRTSGAEAIASAVDLILDGRADAVFAGAADGLSEMLFRGFAERGDLTSGAGGDQACMPFGTDRNGTVPGEAAVFFVLESQAHVAARGARPRAWLARATQAGDSAGALAAAAARLPDGAAPAAVFTCANGSVAWDERLAGELAAAFAGSMPPVTCLKSVCGETLAASAAIDLAGAAWTMKSGVIPATLGPRDCAFPGLDLCLELRQRRTGAALVHCADPTGQAVVLTVLSA